MAVVRDEVCDTDDQPPHQDAVQSDQGGRVDPSGAGEQGRTPECPSPLSWVTKAGTLPGIPVIIAMGTPMAPLLPLQEMVLSDLGSSGASQAEGHGHILGSPCASQCTDHPNLDIGNALMGWRREEGRAGHSQHLGAQENHSWVPRIL